MNKNEYRIDAKIIKELSLFLMLHNVRDFDLSFHTNKENVRFVIKSKNFPENVLQRMIEKLSRKREIAIEVYGWELLGDTDSRNELDILGALIDDIQVSKEDDWDILTLKRNYKYNQ
jgi:hypothetical protein